MPFSLLIAIIIATLCLLASLYDVIARTLPNWLVTVVAALGLTKSALSGFPLSGLAAGAIVFGVAALCWRRGWMGGGDVKFLGAAALAITPGTVPQFVAAVVLAGGVLSLFYLVAQRVVPVPCVKRPDRIIPRILRIEQWRIHRGCPLPYACAIAAGTLYVHF